MEYFKINKSLELHLPILVVILALIAGYLLLKRRNELLKLQRETEEMLNKIHS